MVKCNVTGLNCSKQELGSCLQDGVPDELMLEGHYDRNGTLNHLPELPALNVLTLSGGNIRDIRNGTFETLASLRQLSMNGNSLRVVGTWFEGLEAMVRLYMFQNKIESIKRGAFLPLKKLKFLDMSYNRIRSIQAWFFEGLSGLLDLKLNKNKISHIAADVVFYLGLVGDINLSDNMLQTINPQWFQNLPPRANVYLDNNLLPTVTQETIVALRGKFLRVLNNPFRCTCALTSFKTEGKVDNLYCSYPPHLAGKKISEVSLEDMPCPPPVAQVSRADNGTTLLCEVYWEQRPDISWVGPAGSNITNTSGNGITTHLEHAVTPTGHSISFWTNGSSQHTEASTFNYMGKSTYKLTMSQKALQAWAEDACRCVITYQVDSFSAMTLDLVISLSTSTPNDPHSNNAPKNETTTEKMPVEYFLLPPNQDSCTLDLVYTGVTSVSVSFLVGLLVGWWLIRPKSSTSEQPSNPSSRRSSQESLHHYEVISDSDAVASLPPSDKNLKKRKRWSKHTEIFDNPQYGPGNVKQHRSKRTEIFDNPQYGPGNVKQRWSKHTEVYYSPQYGQAERRRRWSTPVLVAYNGGIGAVPPLAEGGGRTQQLPQMKKD
ncbi:PREDICTED: leucine-rich repeat and fibronectin type-III domain-containing protein 5-like [Branchiostoma belcheri]|uniref:Leucine-rich repeat and fibronectin type-III domain-containing protein 5-like n=1 Tax=Branchiostoma belcheri TaxID=7741 RepID=A0A6P4Y7D6_BRABE|nr:PREDICTED: leucine-rich repeat and fibronectin type-III domain-containing protein 5-like [Branchiostoma belcheri]